MTDRTDHPSRDGPAAVVLARRRRIAPGTLYRGGSGTWDWVAQRVPGVLVFVFLPVHVLDTPLVPVSPEPIVVAGAWIGVGQRLHRAPRNPGTRPRAKEPR